jgi:hypothetical protein
MAQLPQEVLDYAKSVVPNEVPPRTVLSDEIFYMDKK